jgi:hypothetical protein
MYILLNRCPTLQWSSLAPRVFRLQSKQKFVTIGLTSNRRHGSPGMIDRSATSMSASRTPPLS